MRSLTRAISVALTIFFLGSSVSLMACWPEEYRNEHGRPYRHERWHGEHVYQHEDGHWYARRNDGWFVVDARIE